jgi:hypothetical protein
MGRALRRFRVGWVDWWHDLTGLEHVVLVVVLIMLAAGVVAAFLPGQSVHGDYGW